VQPGDRVTITGVYRAMPLRVNPVQTSVKTVFKTHIDVLHVRKVDSKRLRADDFRFVDVVPLTGISDLKKILLKEVKKH